MEEIEIKTLITRPKTSSSWIVKIPAHMAPSRLPGVKMVHHEGSVFDDSTSSLGSMEHLTDPFNYPRPTYSNTLALGRASKYFTDPHNYPVGSKKKTHFVTSELLTVEKINKFEKNPIFTESKAKSYLA
jgi:hypothetical protein